MTSSTDYCRHEDFLHALALFPEVFDRATFNHQEHFPHSLKNFIFISFKTYNKTLAIISNPSF
jgi:hypothetical protein